MFRSTLAAFLAAGFGAVAIGPVRERVMDCLLAPTEAWAVGVVALFAACIWLAVMLCREPKRVATVWLDRPKDRSAPLRDAAGRFKGR